MKCFKSEIPLNLPLTRETLKPIPLLVKGGVRGGFYLLIITTLAIFYFQSFKQPPIYNDPLSSKNNILNQFNYALNLAKIKSSNIIVRDFQNEIEFNITDENNNKSTKIILSLQKDPYWQIASLQEILKIAKMKDKDVKLIDLSINHPYATI